MPKILKYSRNRCTSVEQIDDQTMRQEWRHKKTAARTCLLFQTHPV